MLVKSKPIRAFVKSLISMNEQKYTSDRHETTKENNI